MKIGTIVQDKADKSRIGLVVHDHWGLCSHEEIPVQFEGNDDDFIGMPRQSLIILHDPDNIIISHQGCGLGQGQNCCAFPIAGGNGTDADLRCGRGSKFHDALLQLATRSNRRVPEKLYPFCQLSTESK